MIHFDNAHETQDLAGRGLRLLGRIGTAFGVRHELVRKTIRACRQRRGAGRGASRAAPRETRNPEPGTRNGRT